MLWCYSFCLILLITVINSSYGWRTFWKGRKEGGNLGLPSKSLTTVPLPEEQWFYQNVDHFGRTNIKTWKQRYFINDKFYQTGGPIFLMIGGEGEASAKWMNEGAWIKYAKDFNALCFLLEHRYYGESHPFNDLSTENLGYLASEIALADLAYFIDAMNLEYNKNGTSKWIAFGGSYSGTLAAWLREKYPHLVHGSISSSGPLLAKIDFSEYYDVVEQSLSTHSDSCIEAVREGMDEFEVLLKHMDGQRKLNEEFMLCDPVEKSIGNPLDIENLYENLASNFADVVQYNKDNSPHALINIDDVCDIMVNTTIGSPVTRLAAVNKLFLNSAKEKCLDYKYDKMIEEMKNVSLDSSVSSGARQWTYQTCTEFGFYQTSENVTSIFGNRFTVDFFIKQCSDIFSNKFNSATLYETTKRTNTCYGALKLETTNVLYVHGSIDPWHALGLISSNNTLMPTIFIQGTAHCANMYEPKTSDLPQLIEARKEIELFIKSLLK